MPRNKRLGCCMIFCATFLILCDVCYCVVLYCIVLSCTVLHCPLLHCSTMSPGIDPFQLIIMIITWATASPVKQRKAEISDNRRFPLERVTISSQMQRLRHKLGRSRFLPYPFHFIFRWPSCRPTSFTPSYRHFGQINQNWESASLNISYVYVASNTVLYLGARFGLPTPTGFFVSDLPTQIVYSFPISKTNNNKQ